MESSPSDKVRAKLAKIPPAERVLLLSHCQRPSQACPGKFNKSGLACPPECPADCNLDRLRRAALDAGYAGVCIAAGGAQAVRFVKELKPRGVVAIACHKELDEGLAAVRQLSREAGAPAPPVLAVPLLTDGCVDTTVDMARALDAIRLCLADSTSLTTKARPRRGTRPY